MFSAVIKLAGRKDRTSNPHAVLVPGGKFGVWICGGLGFIVVLFCLIISLVPPGDSTNRWLFFVKVLVETVVAILIGLALYWRGAREKRAAG
jgi:multisubunit Na+/H+ antiporter MnhB subunit